MVYPLQAVVELKIIKHLLPLLGVVVWYHVGRLAVGVFLIGL